MVFIETSIFTRQLQGLLSDDEYRELQWNLVKKPDAGKILAGSGGLRKLRWAAKGKGKSGGVRIIYYWATSQDQLLMLFIYPKAVQDDLTPAQLKTLKAIIEEEYP